MGITRADGSPIPGFSTADGQPVKEVDSVRHTVRWRAGSDVSELSGKAVRLQLQRENAKLYALVHEVTSAPLSLNPGVIAPLYMPSRANGTSTVFASVYCRR